MRLQWQNPWIDVVIRMTENHTIFVMRNLWPSQPLQHIPLYNTNTTNYTTIKKSKHYHLTKYIETKKDEALPVSEKQNGSRAYDGDSTITGKLLCDWGFRVVDGFSRNFYLLENKIFYSEAFSTFKTCPFSSRRDFI